MLFALFNCSSGGGINLFDLAFKIRIVLKPVYDPQQFYIADLSKAIVMLWFYLIDVLESNF